MNTDKALLRGICKGISMKYAESMKLFTMALCLCFATVPVHAQTVSGTLNLDNPVYSATTPLGTFPASANIQRLAFNSGAGGLLTLIGQFTDIGGNFNPQIGGLDVGISDNPQQQILNDPAQLITLMNSSNITAAMQNLFLGNWWLTYGLSPGSQINFGAAYSGGISLVANTTYYLFFAGGLMQPNGAAGTTVQYSFNVSPFTSTAVPLPAAAPLLIAGLAWLAGLIGFKRHQDC